MISGSKKVLFLIPSLTGGGAERVFSVLLRHLDRDQFEPHLAVLQAKGTFMQDVPKDVIVHDLNVSRVRYTLPRLVRLIRQIRPQTVLSTLAHLNHVLIIAKPLLPCGTRLIVREAVMPTSLLENETEHPRFYGFLYRHLYKKADAVVCLSESMVDDFAEHFNVPAEKLVCIYNRVDVERVRAVAMIGDNPYSGQGPHLLAAGRLTRQKGFDVLLDALSSVLTGFPQAKLTLLGEGPLADDLMVQAQRLGITRAVDFLGFQENPWRYIKCADIFVLPSRYEGTPNILLEALALGTPVVASDHPGAIREVFDCHGGMVLVPLEDAGALAEAILSLCRMPERALGRVQPSNGALSMFDMQQAADEYSKLLLS